MKKDLRKINKIIDRAKKNIMLKMQPTIKAAFVGCGRHASENLYPALRYAGIDLIAVCARHLENAEKCALFFGAESVYDDYNEMLENEEIDAIIVCVEPQMHYAVALEALRKGVAVFVEKPPALTVQQAEEMLYLSKANNKFLMVGFNKRFGAIYREAKRIVERNGINTLNSILISAYVGLTKNAENLLLEIGIHYIDLLRYFAGEIKELDVVQKTKGNKASFIISFLFESGVIGTLQLSNTFSWTKPGEYIEISTDEGLLVLENSQRIVYHGPTIASPGEIPTGMEKSEIWFPNYSIPVKENNLFFINGYVPELKYFASRVARNEKGSPDIEDGVEALRIIKRILNTT